MDDIRPNLPSQPVRFMDRLRAFIRSKQMVYSTEKTYCRWVKDFIRFHSYKNPIDMSDSDIDQYLSYLAIHRCASVNTQKTALNALIFMFKQFLNREVGQLNS